MTKVLITGAGGAIGAHMVAHVMTITDWNVIAIDSFQSHHKGYFDRLTRFCQDRPDWQDRITIFPHDLNAPFTPRELEKIGKVDFIINLASRSDVQDSIDDPVPFVRNNTEIMLTMLEAAKSLFPPILDKKTLKVVGYHGKFLHFSTDEVYGPAPKDSGGHKEWEAILPSNPYAASKAAQEALAIAWWRSYSIPVIITNTMNNFGETQAPSKFPAMIQKKLEAGETIKVHATKSGEVGTRYYIHSRNAADAVVFILRNVEAANHQPGEIDRPTRLNIVGDKQVSNLELVQIIAKLMGKEPKYELANFHEDNPGHDLHYGLDGAALLELGWVAPVPFEETLKETIEWQQKNPEWNK